MYHIEFDDIEDKLNKGFTASVWKESRQIAFNKARDLLIEPPTSPIIILLDDNFYYKSMRKSFYKLAIEANKRLGED